MNLDEHVTLTMQRCDHVTAFVRDRELDDRVERAQPSAQHLVELLDALPVVAETAIASGCDDDQVVDNTRIGEIDLVHDEQLGLVGGADLTQHAADGLDLLLGVGRAEPSTTWTSMSTWATSSSVDRKASTSWCGRRRTNPTVSLSSTTSPPGSRRRRVVGSSVENRRSSTRASACVSRLSSVDLPAFV